MSTVPSGRGKRMNIPEPSFILKAQECFPLCWIQCDSVPGNKGSLCLATARLLNASPDAACTEFLAWAVRKAALGYSVTELSELNEIVLRYTRTVF